MARAEAGWATAAAETARVAAARATAAAGSARAEATVLEEAAAVARVAARVAAMVEATVVVARVAAMGSLAQPRSLEARASEMATAAIRSTCQPVIGVCVSQTKMVADAWRVSEEVTAAAKRVAAVAAAREAAIPRRAHNTLFLKNRPYKTRTHPSACVLRELAL